MKNQIIVYTLIASLFFFVWMLIVKTQNITADCELLAAQNNFLLKEINTVKARKKLEFETKLVRPIDAPRKGYIWRIIPGTNQLEWVLPEF